MAFGFPAYHEERWAFSDQAAFVRALREVFREREFTVDRELPTELRARVELSLWSWGESITVTIGRDSAIIRSACQFPLQCIDWGKNRKNVSTLVQGLHQRLPAQSIQRRSAGR
jgi:hypothetical protein